MIPTCTAQVTPGGSRKSGIRVSNSGPLSRHSDEQQGGASQNRSFELHHAVASLSVEPVAELD
jgi:hypothetical protein